HSAGGRAAGIVRRPFLNGLIFQDGLTLGKPGKAKGNHGDRLKPENRIKTRHERVDEWNVHHSKQHNAADHGVPAGEVHVVSLLLPASRFAAGVSLSKQADTKERQREEQESGKAQVQCADELYHGARIAIRCGRAQRHAKCKGAGKSPGDLVPPVKAPARHQKDANRAHAANENIAHVRVVVTADRALQPAALKKHLAEDKNKGKTEPNDADGLTQAYKKLQMGFEGQT